MVSNQKCFGGFFFVSNLVFEYFPGQIDPGTLLLFLRNENNRRVKSQPLYILMYYVTTLVLLLYVYFNDDDTESKNSVQKAPVGPICWTECSVLLFCRPSTRRQVLWLQPK